MTRNKVEIVVTGAEIGVSMANEKIFDNWTSTLDGHFIELFVEFHIDFSWTQVELFESYVECSAAHHIVLASDDFGVYHGLVWSCSIIICIADSMDFPHFVSLKCDFFLVFFQ